jgi:hypothetical protein
MRQSHLPGIELPAHPDIEEAAQDLKEAKDAAKRAADLAKEKEAELVSRMINARVQKHRFSANGNYVDVEVTLPTPSVRVRVTSGDGSE